MWRDGVFRKPGRFRGWIQTLAVNADIKMVKQTGNFITDFLRRYIVEFNLQRHKLHASFFSVHPHKFAEIKPLLDRKPHCPVIKFFVEFHFASEDGINSRCTHAGNRCTHYSIVSFSWSARMCFYQIGSKYRTGFDLRGKWHLIGNGIRKILAIWRAITDIN